MCCFLTGCNSQKPDKHKLAAPPRIYHMTTDFLHYKWFLDIMLEQSEMGFLIFLGYTWVYPRSNVHISSVSLIVIIVLFLLVTVFVQQKLNPDFDFRDAN